MCVRSSISQAPANEIISAAWVINVCNYGESVEITLMDEASKLYINSLMRSRYLFGGEEEGSLLVA